MSTKGVLLVNLGSPDSPSIPDVRRYLREFLMDGRVLDAPWPIRFFVVHATILPFRPKQSAEAYRAIWQTDGSPLISISRRVQVLLQQRLNLPVGLAMRYRNPSIEHALRELVARRVDDLLLIPLFPHYAMSSFETAVERVRSELTQQTAAARLTVQPPCFQHPDYIRALAASTETYLNRPYDHLLISFHGIPERHLRKSDPTRGHCLRTSTCCESPSPAHATCYRAQCFATAQAFVRQTGVTRFSVSFQSRLGREPWLTPYTDLELVRLAQSGVRNLLVMCPAFVADCLETLEEIGIRGRSAFLAAGGKEFHLIPCLNDHPLWVQTLEKMAVAFAPGSSAAVAGADAASRTPEPRNEGKT